MRWPEGPPHLALNPPYVCLFVCFVCFVCFVLFCLFPFFAFNRKKLFFFVERAFLFTFECLPMFLLSLFLASPFFSFSFSVSLLFFSFFLPCLTFLLSFGSLFLYLSLLFCLLCFCFMKGTTSKDSIAKLFSSILSLLFGFLPHFLIEIPFFLSLLFC